MNRARGALKTLARTDASVLSPLPVNDSKVRRRVVPRGRVIARKVHPHVVRKVHPAAAPRGHVMAKKVHPGAVRKSCEAVRRGRPAIGQAVRRASAMSVDATEATGLA